MNRTPASVKSVIEALRAGALGYLTKDAGRDDIVRALRSAAAGHAILDPVARTRLLAASGDGAARETAPQWRLPPDELTSRETEVLRLIASGLTNAVIARTLFISENTVKSHINHLFAKIGARDRAQAVAYAYRNGLAAE